MEHLIPKTKLVWDESEKGWRIYYRDLISDKWVWTKSMRVLTKVPEVSGIVRTTYNSEYLIMEVRDQ